jgi:hypothetical protein
MTGKTSPLKRRLNTLARKFYAAHGYQVSADYDFERAVHPHEQGMWNLAVLAHEHFTGDTPDPGELEDLP